MKLLSWTFIPAHPVSAHSIYPACDLSTVDIGRITIEI